MSEAMKWIIAVLLLGATLLFIRVNLFEKATTNLYETVNNEGQKLQEKSEIRLREIQEKAKTEHDEELQEEWASTKTKIYVPKKDTKTCMKILNTTEINNLVIECNKDHYVKIRNDEVNNFKKENEL